MAKSKKSNAKPADKTKVITGVCRSSYMFLNELTPPKDKNGNVKEGAHMCRTSIIIPKKDKETIKKIRVAIKRAAEAKMGADVNVKARKFLNPLRDADAEMESGDFEPDNPKDYKGCYFLNAKGYKLPGLVDAENNPIIDQEEREEILVSGYYFRFSISFRGFDNESKGVRVLLNNLMFIKEGERLDGGKSAEEDFEDYAV